MGLALGSAETTFREQARNGGESLSVCSAQKGHKAMDCCNKERDTPFRTTSTLEVMCNSKKAQPKGFCRNAGNGHQRRSCFNSLNLFSQACMK
jgi:hypothetical protein